MIGVILIILLSIALIISSLVLHNKLSGSGAPVSDKGFDMFFPPYDCPTGDQTMVDLQMIQKVTDAAKAFSGKLDPHDPKNPFQIKYSVYNLYDKSYLTGLINAFKAGVYVQVLIQYTQEEKPIKSKDYNHIYIEFKKEKLSVLPDRNDTQRDITNKEDFNTLNLIPINITKLMHVKTRYYKFGQNGATVIIDGKTKHINECVVTGSFNPECAATTNNEFLFVISSNKDKTPVIITNYLRIFEFTKREYTKFELPEPDSKDPIYNTNDNLNVIYSRWCKNSNSYMRYILSKIIDKEKSAILLPLYSLSNLDSPFMYDKGNSISVENADKINYIKSSDYYTADMKISGISSKLKNWGVNGLGSRVDIEYSYEEEKSGKKVTKSKTYSTVIRDIDKDTITVISTYTDADLSNGGKIKNITIYKTLMTNFGNAIKRGVKIILLINKSQLDGEVSSSGISFTGGDSSLTGYILKQMGATLYRCTNPNGELHSKSGYFYSQNILITDTTNWSDAGMGSQNKTSPSCSINAETCLVINGNKFQNPELFRTRVLANFINTVRMYEYQQYCPINEPDTFGGKSISAPLNQSNYMNCTCPSSDMVCVATGTKHLGLCSEKFTSQKNKSNCYLGTPHHQEGYPIKGTKCTGSCTADCCLRYGQKQADEDNIKYENVLKLLSSLPQWPKFKCSDNDIDSNPLGTKVFIKSKMYIIDPTFNWGTGIRINNRELENVIKTKNIDGKNMTNLTDKNKQGFFCKTKSICY